MSFNCFIPDQARIESHYKNTWDWHIPINRREAVNIAACGFVEFYPPQLEMYTFATNILVSFPHHLKLQSQKWRAAFKVKRQIVSMRQPKDFERRKSLNWY